MCHRTWRIYQHTRGRKSRRKSPASNDQNLLFRYLDRKIPSIAAIAEQQQYPSASALEKRIRLARDAFLCTPWSAPPDGDLIVIADALLIKHEGAYCTLYVLMFRSILGSKAFFYKPLMHPGKESVAGWKAAFGAVDASILARVRALVGDGHKGLYSTVLRQGWIMQRCHFHAWKSIQNYIRAGPSALYREYAHYVHGLIATVLYSYDDNRALQAFGQLQDARKHAPSRGAARTIRSVVYHHRSLRSYIYYDSLNLPRTSNCAESTMNTIRSLEKQARGWATPHSFEAWACATLKHKQFVICRAAPDELLY